MTTLTHTNITKREIRQRNRNGKWIYNDRYILHFNDPATGKRRMRRFKTRKKAEAVRNEIIKNADVMKRRKGDTPITLSDAVDYWLKSKESAISPSTLKSYRQVSRDYVIGPLIKGDADLRRQYGMTGKKPADLELVEMLSAKTKIEEITTSQIRMWHLRIIEHSTTYVAKQAKKNLSSVFRLIEEDFELRLARIPLRPGPVHRRARRELLSEEQVRMIIAHAQTDKKWGLYYAFPFLTGVRPSEMLGLLWKDVDLDKKIIRICRTQDPDGSLKSFTKTDAGMREVPMSDLLHGMLISWQENCPRFKGRLYRVFPIQASEDGKGARPSLHEDGRFLLHNFRNRVWYKILKKLGLPQIAPYAARHMAISHLQAQGIELGVVAKIAGHANPNITLQYYTHAVRKHEGVMDQLSDAYGLEKPVADRESGVQT